MCKKLTTGSIFLFVFFIMIISCSSKKEESSKMSEYRKGQFGYDLTFLKKYDNPVVLKNADGDAQIIVSPKYQGKVFTSTAGGLDGFSFGWINYKLFESGEIQRHINAYGGEERLWLGPEGGQFSIFFPKGAEMVFDNWNTPAPIDTEPFTAVSQSDGSINMQKEMKLENYSGTKFNLKINRDVRLLNKKEIENIFDVTLPGGVKSVAYETKNSVTNTGDTPWTKESGTVCIWLLGMYKPSDKMTVVIPYVEGDETQLGKIATTDYFGEIPKERILMKDGYLFFKADGKKRSKLGLSPLRAKNIAGSYDALNNVLTVIKYSIDKNAAYINQLWEIQKEPFKGDVVNSYNDGPLDDGSQLGPFYELESSSPAAFLQPAQKMSHLQQTVHFAGSKNDLDVIAKKVFGIGVDEISNALK